MQAKNSEKVPVTTSAKESKILRSFYPSRKKETTIIHAKNLEKVRAQRRVQFLELFTLAEKKTRVIYA